MATLVPTLSTALTVGASIAGNQIQRRQARDRRDQTLEQLQRQQRLQEQQNAQDAALQRGKIALDKRQSEEERRAALKRAVARQRANFSAQGVGAGSGSSQAVLLGLFDESEDDARRREELDQLRLTGINQGLSQRSSLNVLQRTQLAERNDLANSADGVNFGFDIARGVIKSQTED